MRDNTASDMATMTPFRLDDDSSYRRWRDAKLASYPASLEELVVEVRDPKHLSDAEADAIRDRCRRANMAIYAGPPDDGAADKEIPRRLGTQLGLNRLDPNMLADEDGITSLTVVPGKSGRGYIPYSNRRLLWHTDGYYNPPERTIRAMLLHCVRPAAEGGENRLLDHELAYIALRDENPDWIAALMAPDAMTIPANEEAGEVARGAQAGPVFSLDPVSGNLHMRYTARVRSIEWKDDAPMREAVAALERILGAESPHVFRHRLQAGQGLICNNVLHNRSEFSDAEGGGKGRLVYRARYYDRIRGTDWNLI
jgi:alpha-ketoglutarate-dependent taurine dioxygenase